MGQKCHEHVKVLECHPVISIGPLQQRLEHGEVAPRQQAALGGVCHPEENRELGAPDLRQVALGRNSIYEGFWVQKPSVFG